MTLDCPTNEQLAAFVGNGLGDRERRIVVAHLAICDTCRQLVAAAAFLYAGR